MRMRPLLMSAPMVLATLADDKTVTRRLPGLEEVNQEPDVWQLDDFVQITGPGTTSCLEARFKAPGRPPRFVRCPYGVPGDGLWVRENFRLESMYDDLAPSVAPSDRRVWFEADGEKPEWAGRLRPSIHIPRWLSRLDLEEGEIFPDRLCNLTEADAKREGVSHAVIHEDFSTSSGWYKTYLPPFRLLWDSINPKMPFERNPWVWVINFKRLKQ